MNDIEQPLIVKKKTPQEELDQLTDWSNTLLIIVYIIFGVTMLLTVAVYFFKRIFLI